MTLSRTGDAGPRMSNTLRVATLNIWNRTGPWEERLGAIRAGLRELSPDLVGLQEVLRLAADFGDGLDQGAAIAEGLGYEVAYGRAHDDAYLGNAALSRWPIAQSHVYELPRVGTDERRTLLFAEVRSPWGPVRFFVTHLNWKFDEGHVREAQVREVVARVEAVMQGASTAEMPAILVGDFNAEPDADEIRYLRGLASLGGSRRVYFRDAFAGAGDGSPGHTFSRRNPFAEPLREPDRRIDYILVHGHEAGRGEPLDARVCFDAPVDGIFPSDHFGVVATLRA
jgi:endonuclease/exonuclease/phosphatase family metal-dependent hydrolase